MSTLSYILATIKWLGSWRLTDWSSQWKTNLYLLYNVVLVFSLLMEILSKMIYLVKFLENSYDIVNSLFITLTEINAVYKTVNVVNRRRDIILLTNSLANGIGTPNDDEEIKFQRKFDEQNRRTTVVYHFFVGCSVFSMIVLNFAKNVPQRTLPDNACFPFDLSTARGYWSANVFQAVAKTFCAISSAAYDCLFCGLMVQICAQLRILQYRLESIHRASRDSIDNDKFFNNERSVETVEKRMLEHCINHHRHIFKCTTLIDDIFGAGILVQYAVSTVVLCCNVYMLSKAKPFSSEFMFIIAYTISVLIQLFVYCWHGNEVIIESMNIRNSIYAMDWTKLKLRTQKYLLILMNCTLEPIKFTSASVIVLSLDTYKSLVKLSYSMYNLLQQSSDL